MELVIASQNLHKVREYREMLKALPAIDVLSLLDFVSYKPPEVSGQNFKERATLRAEHAAHALQRWVLADDSGLVIPQPEQRFFCGEDAADTDSCKHVMNALAGKADAGRSVYMECALAFADPSGLKKCVTGMCEGTVVDAERGRNGFGYDSIFRKHDYDKTFAELDEATKIRISHRRKAFEKLAIFLETLIP